MNNWYIPRKFMPQIDDADYSDLIKWLTQRGVGGGFGQVSPQSLRAHQYIDVYRAESMPDAVKKIPVLISQDNYVLDGNHRWQANVHDKTDLGYIEIALPFEDALDELFAYPKVMTSNTEKFKDGMKLRNHKKSH